MVREEGRTSQNGPVFEKRRKAIIEVICAAKEEK
jgi:hypothetical protein